MTTLDDIRHRARTITDDGYGVYNATDVARLRIDIETLLTLLAKDSPALEKFYLRHNGGNTDLHHEGCSSDRVEGGYVAPAFSATLGGLVAEAVMHECEAEPVDWWQHLPDDIHARASAEAASG